MKRKSLLVLLVLAVQLAFTVSASPAGGRTEALGVIYVTSQSLYYDTFVSAETVSMESPFQKLENG